jgi:hypothetical protein
MDDENIPTEILIEIAREVRAESAKVISDSAECRRKANALREWILDCAQPGGEDS